MWATLLLEQLWNLESHRLILRQLCQDKLPQQLQMLHLRPLLRPRPPPTQPPMQLPNKPQPPLLTPLHPLTLLRALSPHYQKLKLKLLNKERVKNVRMVISLQWTTPVNYIKSNLLFSTHPFQEVNHSNFPSVDTPSSNAGRPLSCRWNLVKRPMFIAQRALPTATEPPAKFQPAPIYFLKFRSNNARTYLHELEINILFKYR